MPNETTFWEDIRTAGKMLGFIKPDRTSTNRAMFEGELITIPAIGGCHGSNPWDFDVPDEQAVIILLTRCPMAWPELLDTFDGDVEALRTATQSLERNGHIRYNNRYGWFCLV